MALEPLVGGVKTGQKVVGTNLLLAFIHSGQCGFKTVRSGHGFADNLRYVEYSRHPHMVVTHGGSEVNHFLCFSYVSLVWQGGT